MEDNTEEKTSVLDLPELALDCILERLPPDALCSMAGVCTSLRERCMSDRLWEKHMKQKWGNIIGQAAYREWQWQIASKADLGNLKQGKQKGLMRILSLNWPFSWIRSKVDDYNNSSSTKPRSPLPVDSIMAWYLALETGKFCFPAQVYNREVYYILTVKSFIVHVKFSSYRLVSFGFVFSQDFFSVFFLPFKLVLILFLHLLQNGHVGFMLSCYDAQISYDPRTDTFQAR